MKEQEISLSNDLLSIGFYAEVLYLCASFPCVYDPSSLVTIARLLTWTDLQLEIQWSHGGAPTLASVSGRRPNISFKGADVKHQVLIACLF
jgi:hypothetical protein